MHKFPSNIGGKHAVDCGAMKTPCIGLSSGTPGVRRGPGWSPAAGTRPNTCWAPPSGPGWPSPARQSCRLGTGTSVSSWLCTRGRFACSSPASPRSSLPRPPGPLAPPWIRGVYFSVCPPTYLGTKIFIFGWIWGKYDKELMKKGKREGKIRREREEIRGKRYFLEKKNLRRGGGIWILKLIFTPTFNCSGGEPVKMSSKSKLGLEMSILWGLSSVNISREWRRTFSRTPQIQINYLWQELG